MPFEFERQSIRDVILIKPKIFGDSRGFFAEIYKKSEFQNNGILEEFVQDNYSKSSYGVLRGLHFQVKNKSQSKLVKCIKGKIVDIVVDIRSNSESFKKYLKFELSAENSYMLYVPRGFAHGFVSLSDSAEVIYKTSEEYSPESERGIVWNDSCLNIDWGIDFTPLLSAKDAVLPAFDKIKLEEIL